MNLSLPDIFQSTLPIQGETGTLRGCAGKGGISIHSPYTGRDIQAITLSSIIKISIHSPYTGRDFTSIQAKAGGIYFNPLSLYRERRFGELQ